MGNVKKSKNSQRDGGQKTEKKNMETAKKNSQKGAKFTVPRGMKDILPEEYKYWIFLKNTIGKLAEIFGFQQIETPVLEYAKFYEKGTGESSDIVRKEMFSLKTKGGDDLVLRPEATPAHVRSYIENGMSSWPQPVKICSVGSMFRYERPQAGRKREFHQFDFDSIGDGDAVIDAQIIYLSWKIFEKIGLKKISIQINSIGCESCRKDYKNILLNFLKNRKNDLCEDCVERMGINLLRILDCKQDSCQEILAEAPQIVDYLCKDCHDHFMYVLEYLDELEIVYFLNPRLIRGLDYYTRTVFEIGSEEEEFKNAKISFGGGGRYDNLVKLLGGKDTPAAGFALGLDRIVMLMQHQGISIPKKAGAKVFLIALGVIGKKKSLKIFDSLINSGISVSESFSKGSLKNQLKAADKEKSALAVIIGQKEALDETAIIRDMASGAQEIVVMDSVVSQVKRMLKNI